MIRHGSMFSGIEGFGLGLEMAGWDVETVWQSDINPFVNKLNAKRYPDAAQLGDITSGEHIPYVDVLTAGFPCQPASQAGKGLAQDDPRWLWPHVAGVMREIRPELVIAENVRGLKARGLHIVLQDLADLGYDAQWDLIPAGAVGAPHLRHRFWIVAYPQREQSQYGLLFDEAPEVYRWPDEEPCKPRLVTTSPDRRPRLTALGNAVVPHAVCFIARRIVSRVDDPLVLLGEARDVDSFDGKPPYAGVLRMGKVYEQPTCAPKMKKARLWPTAAANDAVWGLDALAACVDVDGKPARDPHKRFYHPTTGQIVQRTLANYVIGAEAGLWDLPGEGRLWPTAVVSDAEGSRRKTAQTEAWKSKEGETLTDAVWIEEGVDVTATHGVEGRGGTADLADRLGDRPQGLPPARAAATAAGGGGTQRGRPVADAARELRRRLRCLTEPGRGRTRQVAQHRPDRRRRP